MKNLLIIYVAVCLSCCTSLIKKENENTSKSKIIITGVMTNIFCNNILYTCYINGEKKFLISDISCSIDGVSFHSINVGDTIEVPVFLAPKPPYSNFIPKDMMLQDHSSLFIISSADFEYVLAVATKDSIIADLYYSPNICNGYLLYH